MNDQHRVVKVFSSLIVAMTIGSFVLMALDKKSLSPGTFSLAGLYSLNPANEQVIKDKKTTNWDGVEIYYSKNPVNNFDKLVCSSDIDLHFAIANITSGKEGVIRATEKWKNQRPCQLDIKEGQNIIRICIASDSGRSEPTNTQVSRTMELVEVLTRDYNISPNRIRYPVNWQI